MLKHEIYNSSEKNIRLDIFLVNHIDDYSRSKIKKLINEGCIKVDNYSVKSSYKLKGLEYITIEDIETGQENYIEKENIPIDIIYEDKSFIIINKPAGLVVHPGAGNKKGTLLNGLLYHFDELSMMNDSRPGIIHRLDKNTSGVMIIAKSDRVHYMISEQFANRTVRKVYRAVVWGKLPDVGNIEGYIKRDKKNRTKFMLHDSKGKYSFTKYKKIKDKIPKDNIIEVEVKTMEEVEEALNNKVDIIMLDNMNIEIMKQAIQKINGKAKIEISGGVTYESLAEISKIGADFISIGALTHSAAAVDISMNITPK